MYEKLGVDLGNFDTKSQDTSTPNGYTVHTILPPMSKEYLYFNGKYYCPNEKRFNYMEDKTATERALILALFGISKQLIFRAKQKKAATPNEIQDKLNGMNEIILGLGLPLTHMSKAKDTKDYFEQYMKDGISFVYNDFHFHLTLVFSHVFPQNYAAIYTNCDDEVICKYKKFWGADLGGGTIDLLQIVNGMPDVGNCITDNLGSLYMYKHIIQSIKRDFNITLTDVDIEEILRGRPNILSESRPEVKTEIKFLVQSWVDDRIVDFMVQNGVNFETSIVIFFGGFALLLRPYLLKNKLLKNAHFLKNPVKANARGYAILVERLYLEKRG